MIITKLWDKISLWQKRLVMFVSIVVSISVLYPKVKTAINGARQIIEFQRQSEQITSDIFDLKGYIQVLSGILRATLHKLDDNNYGTIIIVEDEITHKKENKLVEVKLRKSETGDIFVFVPDNQIGVYSISFNHDEGKYSYIDFKGHYHLIYKVNLVRTIDKQP